MWFIGFLLTLEVFDAKDSLYIISFVFSIIWPIFWLAHYGMIAGEYTWKFIVALFKYMFTQNDPF